MRVNRTFFRYLAYALEILIFYILQGTPNFIPEIFGGKPLLLIPAALTIAAAENKIPSLVFGAVCGILTDIGSGGSVGFFAVFLTLLCYLEAHIFENYIIPSVFTVTAVSAVAVPCIICLYFLLFVILPGTEEFGYLFVHHYISKTVYTFAMTVPFYFLNRFFYNTLSIQSR